MSGPGSFSITGRRRYVVKALLKLQRDNKLGVITNLKLVKVGWLTYYLYCEAEVKL